MIGSNFSFQRTSRSGVALIQMVHSRPHRLATTLQGMKEQSFEDFDFFVIANNPSNLDLFSKTFSENKQGNFHFVDNTQGNTLCVSRWFFANTLKEQGYETFIFLDDDIWFTKDFISDAVKLKRVDEVKSWFAWKFERDNYTRKRVWSEEESVDYVGAGGGLIFDASILDIPEIAKPPSYFHNAGDDLWSSCVLLRRGVRLRFAPLDIGFYGDDETSDVAVHLQEAEKRSSCISKAFYMNGLISPGLNTTGGH